MTSPHGVPPCPARLDRVRPLQQKLIWALVILLITGIPLVLFALVGLPHLFRRSSVRTVVAVDSGGEPPGITSPYFGHAFALTTGVPMRPGTTEAALVCSPPLTGSTTAERLIALSIAGARHRLYIANAYFIPDAPFIQLLVDAARRGVDVRILTNSAQSDVKTAWLAGRARYEALLAGGVRIFEYRPTTMHSKTLVVDGSWSAVSTMNFDNRSFAYNAEVALVACDTAIGTSMESLYLDDLRFADEITFEVFRRRSRTQRLLERAASVVARVL